MSTKVVRYFSEILDTQEIGFLSINKRKPNKFHKRNVYSDFENIHEIQV